ncbi:hypothetical protein OQA88_758 [Cercophora sp. LCS_1]
MNSGISFYFDEYVLSSVDYAPPLHSILHERLELVNVLGLNLPSVGPVSLGKVLGRLLASLEQPLQPMQLGLAELAAVVAEEIATMSEIQVALPSSRTRRLFPPADDGGLSSHLEEGNILPPQNIASKSFDEWTEIIYPNNASLRAEVARAYAVGTSWQIQSEADARDLLHPDYQFACITAYEANMTASIGVPTWRYLFNASLPGDRLAGHGSDVGFVFGAAQSSEANRILSRRIQAAWGSFAKNPLEGPGWTKYGSAV